MEPERRRPVGWLLVAAVAALLGAVQVVLTVAWLMMAPDDTGRVLIAFPWLLLWYLVALGALRAARREPRPDDPMLDLWDGGAAPPRKRR